MGREQGKMHRHVQLPQRTPQTFKYQAQAFLVKEAGLHTAEKKLMADTRYLRWRPSRKT
jgi:hypothetical protein